MRLWYLLRVIFVLAPIILNLLTKKRQLIPRLSRLRVGDVIQLMLKTPLVAAKIQGGVFEATRRPIQNARSTFAIVAANSASNKILLLQVVDPANSNIYGSSSIRLAPMTITYSQVQSATLYRPMTPAPSETVIANALRSIQLGRPRPADVQVRVFNLLLF